jgi:transcription elongation factor GreA
MAYERSTVSTCELPSPLASGLTRGELAELSDELRALRDRYEGELSERLRDARAYGSPGDHEDVLAVHEEASVFAARIARLEALLRSAAIVESEFDGRASLGCTVRVAIPGGRVAEYVLVGRRTDSSSLGEVSSGSPVGRSLPGARPGDVVRVELPSGHGRELRVLAVSPPADVVEASPGAEAA